MMRFRVLALLATLAAVSLAGPASSAYRPWDDCVQVEGGTACGYVVYSGAAFTAEGEATVSVWWQQCVYTQYLPTECSNPFYAPAYANTMGAPIGWGCVSSTLYANGKVVSSTMRYC